MPSSQAYICASSGRGVSVISVSTVNHASYSYRSLLDRFGAIILGIREAASPYMCAVLNVSLQFISGFLNKEMLLFSWWETYFRVFLKERFKGRASFIHFFWLTVLSTTVLSTKNRVFAKSHFYPLLEILLKIPFYSLFSQMKRLLARFVK